MRPGAILGRAVTLALCLVTAACSLARRDPGSAARGTRLGPAETDEVVAKLTARDEAVRSFKSLARVTVTRGEERQTFRQVVVFERPDALRIETIPVTGTTALSLLVAGPGGAVFLDVPAKRAVTGPPDRAFFSSAVGFPADVAELISYLTGGLPPGDAAAGMIAARDGEGTVTVTRPDTGSTWRAAGPGLDVREAEVRDRFKGTILFTARYDDYRPEGDVSLPRKVVFEVPRLGVRTEVTFGPPAVNVPVKQALFVTDVPEDFERSSAGREAQAGAAG